MHLLIPQIKLTQRVKTPIGENSYSSLLANKICLQLMGMPNSDNYCKPWVRFGQSRGSQKEKDEKL